MRLYLVRHGAAQDKAGREDSARALTPQGRDDVVLVASFVGAGVERPLRIVSSPYLRAEQSAEALREALHFTEKIEPSDALLPESGWPQLREVLVGFSHAGVRTVVGVGHNPSISQMCGLIVAGTDEAALELSKGAVACIELEDLHARPAGRLRWLVTPNALRAAGSSGPKGAT